MARLCWHHQGSFHRNEKAKYKSRNGFVLMCVAGAAVLQHRHSLLNHVKSGKLMGLTEEEKPKSMWTENRAANGTAKRTKTLHPDHILPSRRDSGALGDIILVDNLSLNVSIFMSFLRMYLSIWLMDADHFGLEVLLPARRPHENRVVYVCCTRLNLRREHGVVM